MHERGYVFIPIKRTRYTRMYGKERENNGRELERRTEQRRKEEEEHKTRKIEKRVRFDRAEESGKIRRDVDWDRKGRKQKPIEVKEVKE